MKRPCASFMRCMRRSIPYEDKLPSAMSAWQRTELARHAQRPYTLDTSSICSRIGARVHGDRAYGDDPALLCGMARFRGEEVMVIGHQKGRDTKSRLHRNFGQANPEGYRKALRAMKMAEKFKRPVITLIDTPGAYPVLARKSADKPKLSHVTCVRWRACVFPSSQQ